MIFTGITCISLTSLGVVWSPILQRLGRAQVFVMIEWTTKNLEFPTFLMLVHLRTYSCCSKILHYHPSRTLLNLSRGIGTLSSSLLLDEQSSHFSSTCGEQRNCSSGSRYLPQKSTNLMCLTRASKYTPLQHGFTQRWALLRYCNKCTGRSSEPYLIPIFFMQRPLSSNNEGGLKVISRTKRTTRGLSLRLNSSRFRSFISATGSNVSLLLWRLKDCRCVSFTSEDGRDSILLSQRFKALSLRRLPSSLGTDVSSFPPR